jgi:hypothetical protein
MQLVPLRLGEAKKGKKKGAGAGGAAVAGDEEMEEGGEEGGEGGENRVDDDFEVGPLYKFNAVDP